MTKQQQKQLTSKRLNELFRNLKQLQKNYDQENSILLLDKIIATKVMINQESNGKYFPRHTKAPISKPKVCHLIEPSFLAIA